MFGPTLWFGSYPLVKFPVIQLLPVWKGHMLPLVKPLYVCEVLSYEDCTWKSVLTSLFCIYELTIAWLSLRSRRKHCHPKSMANYSLSDSWSRVAVDLSGPACPLMWYGEQLDTLDPLITGISDTFHILAKYSLLPEWIINMFALWRCYYHSFKLIKHAHSCSECMRDVVLEIWCSRCHVW